MDLSEREVTEAKADRAMRRGELSTALELFQQLVAQFPDDAGLKRKLSGLKENLQPMELVSAKSRFTPEPAPVAGANPLDEAEVLASRGDHAGAIALYRKALAEKPDSELLKERLTELFRLVQAQAPRAPVVRSKEVVLSEWLDRISLRKKPG
jgi:tetratricopeptide (TPR) repeat protein